MEVRPHKLKQLLAVNLSGFPLSRDENYSCVSVGRDFYDFIIDSTTKLYIQIPDTLLYRDNKIFVFYTNSSGFIQFDTYSLTSVESKEALFDDVFRRFINSHGPNHKSDKSAHSRIVAVQKRMTSSERFFNQIEVLTPLGLVAALLRVIDQNLTIILIQKYISPKIFNVPDYYRIFSKLNGPTTGWCLSAAHDGVPRCDILLPQAGLQGEELETTSLVDVIHLLDRDINQYLINVVRHWDEVKAEQEDNDMTLKRVRFFLLSNIYDFICKMPSLLTDEDREAELRRVILHDSDEYFYDILKSCWAASTSDRALWTKMNAYIHKKVGSFYLLSLGSDVDGKLDLSQLPSTLQCHRLSSQSPALVAAEKIISRLRLWWQPHISKAYRSHLKEMSSELGSGLGEALTKRKEGRRDDNQQTQGRQVPEYYVDDIVCDFLMDHSCTISVQTLHERSLWSRTPVQFPLYLLQIKGFRISYSMSSMPLSTNITNQSEVLPFQVCKMCGWKSLMSRKLVKYLAVNLTSQHSEIKGGEGSKEGSKALLDGETVIPGHGYQLTTRMAVELALIYRNYEKIPLTKFVRDLLTTVCSSMDTRSKVPWKGKGGGGVGKQGQGRLSSPALEALIRYSQINCCHFCQRLVTEESTKKQKGQLFHQFITRYRSNEDKFDESIFSTSCELDVTFDRLSAQSRTKLALITRLACERRHNAEHWNGYPPSQPSLGREKVIERSTHGNNSRSKSYHDQNCQQYSFLMEDLVGGISKETLLSTSSCHPWSIDDLDRGSCQWRLLIMAHYLSEVRLPPSHPYFGGMAALVYDLGQAKHTLLFPLEFERGDFTTDPLIPIQQCRLHYVLGTINSLRQYMSEKQIAISLYLISKSSLQHCCEANRHLSPSSPSFTHADAYLDTTFSLPLEAMRKLEWQSRLGTEKSDYFLPLESSILGTPSIKISLAIYRDDPIPSALFSFHPQEYRQQDSRSLHHGTEDFSAVLPVDSLPFDHHHTLGSSAEREEKSLDHATFYPSFITRKMIKSGQQILLLRECDIFWPPPFYFDGQALPEPWLAMLWTRKTEREIELLGMGMMMSNATNSLNHATKERPSGVRGFNRDNHISIALDDKQKFSSQKKKSQLQQTMNHDSNFNDTSGMDDGHSHIVELDHSRKNINSTNGNQNTNSSHGYNIDIDQHDYEDENSLIPLSDDEDDDNDGIDGDNDDDSDVSKEEWNKEGNRTKDVMDSDVVNEIIDAATTKLENLFRRCSHRIPLHKEFIYNLDKRLLTDDFVANSERKETLIESREKNNQIHLRNTDDISVDQSFDSWGNNRSVNSESVNDDNDSTSVEVGYYEMLNCVFQEYKSWKYEEIRQAALQKSSKSPRFVSNRLQIGRKLVTLALEQMIQQNDIPSMVTWDMFHDIFMECIAWAKLEMERIRQVIVADREGKALLSSNRNLKRTVGDENNVSKTQKTQQCLSIDDIRDMKTKLMDISDSLSIKSSQTTSSRYDHSHLNYLFSKGELFNEDVLTWEMIDSAIQTKREELSKHRHHHSNNNIDNIEGYAYRNLPSSSERKFRRLMIQLSIFMIVCRKNHTNILDVLHLKRYLESQRSKLLKFVVLAKDGQVSLPTIRSTSFEKDISNSFFFPRAVLCAQLLHSKVFDSLFPKEKAHFGDDGDHAVLSDIGFLSLCESHWRNISNHYLSIDEISEEIERLNAKKSVLVNHYSRRTMMKLTIAVDANRASIASPFIKNSPLSHKSRASDNDEHSLASPVLSPSSTSSPLSHSFSTPKGRRQSTVVSSISPLLVSNSKANDTDRKENGRRLATSLPSSRPSHSIRKDYPPCFRLVCDIHGLEDFFIADMMCCLCELDYQQKLLSSRHGETMVISQPSVVPELSRISTSDSIVEEFENPFETDEFRGSRHSFAESENPILNEEGKEEDEEDGEDIEDSDVNC